MYRVYIEEIKYMLSLKSLYFKHLFNQQFLKKFSPSIY